MSIETQLAALRMQEQELLATRCADCGHSLRMHSRVSKPTCKTWTGRQRACKCKGFADPADRLALVKK